jgi:hypothetical protein
MKSVNSEKQGTIWSFLLALTKLSQSSLSLITDLIEIPMNTDTELKKVFMIGAYEQTLFLQSMQPSERNSVIRSYLRLTPGQLNTVVIHVKELFTEDMNGNQCSKIIEVCQELTPMDIELRSKILQMHAFSLFTETMNGDDKSEIISACLKLNPEQIIAITLQAPSLFTKSVYGYQYRMIISQCSELEPDDIALRAKNLQNYASSFFSNSMDKSNYSIISSVCLRLKPEQIAIVAKHANKLFTEDMDGNQCSKIIKACVGLKPEDIASRSETLQMHTSSLFTEIMDEHEKSEVISAYLKLNPEQITAVALHGNALFTEGMNGTQRSHIIKTCIDLSPEDIAVRSQTFRREGSSLFTKDMQIEDKSELISACLKLNPTQITAIEALANNCFTKRDYYYLSNIANASANLMTEQISTIGAYAKDLFPRNDLLSESKNVEALRTNIKCCINLTPEQITVLRIYVKDHLKDISLREQWRIVDGFLKSPSQDLSLRIETIKKHLPYLLTKELRESEDYLAPIIETYISLIPEDIIARTQAIQRHILPIFYKEYVNGDHQSEDISNFLKLKPEQIAAIGAQDIFIKNMDRHVIRDMTAACIGLNPKQIEALGKGIKPFFPETFVNRYDVNMLDFGGLLKTCATLTPSDIALRTKAIQEHAFFFFKGGRYLTNQISLIEALLKLSPEDIALRIQAIQIHMPSLQMQSVEELYNIDIIKTYLNLTPEDITLRTQALQMYIPWLVTQSMSGYQQNNIIQFCLKLTPEQIHIVGIAAKNYFTPSTKVAVRNTLTTSFLHRINVSLEEEKQYMERLQK